FEKGTPEYQYAQAILKEVPSIATHPARNMILGDFMVGWGLRVTRNQQAADGSQTDTKTPDAKNPLQRKIPPIAQHVARTPSRSGAPNGQKKVDEAMNNFVKEGGSQESLAAAIGAIRRSGPTTTDKRSRTLV